MRNTVLTAILLAKIAEKSATEMISINILISLFILCFSLLFIYFQRFTTWLNTYSLHFNFEQVIIPFSAYFTLCTLNLFTIRHMHIYNIFHFFSCFFCQAKNAWMFSISICVLTSTVKLLHVNLHFNLPRVNITHSHLHPIFFCSIQFSISS